MPQPRRLPSASPWTLRSPRGRWSAARAWRRSGSGDGPCSSGLSSAIMTFLNNCGERCRIRPDPLTAIRPAKHGSSASNKAFSSGVAAAMTWRGPGIAKHGGDGGGNAALRHRQRRYFDAAGPRRIQKGAGAAARIVQHRLDPAGGEGVAYLTRQAGHRNHPIGRLGHDRQTALAAVHRRDRARDRRRRDKAAWRLSSAPSSSPLPARDRARPRHRRLAAHDLGEPGMARGFGGMFADRKQRQFEQPVACELGSMPRSALALVTMTASYRASSSSWNGNGSNRSIGASNTSKPLRAQACGCDLIVGMRAGNENGHASGLRRRDFELNGRLHFATSQCYAKIGKRRFDRQRKGLNWVTTRRCWCWVSRPPAMKPRPPWSSARATGRGGSCPISCARRPKSMRASAAWCRRSPRAPMSTLLDGIVGSAMKEAGIGFRKLSAVAAAAGSRPDRRRDRRPDHREGDRDGARYAADRGEPSRGPRADAAADLRARRFPIACFSPPAATPRSSPWSASATMSGSAPRSTTPWARPSTRSRKCSALPYPGGPRGRACGRRRRCQTVCISAADARTPRRQLLAIGIEDRGA